MKIKFLSFVIMSFIAFGLFISFASSQTSCSGNCKYICDWGTEQQVSGDCLSTQMCCEKIDNQKAVIENAVGEDVSNANYPSGIIGQCCLKVDGCAPLSENNLTPEACRAANGGVIECSNDACKNAGKKSDKNATCEEGCQEYKNSSNTQAYNECIARCTGTYTGGSTFTTTFPNPLGFTTVQEMLSKVLGNLMGLILIVAVIFIVLGGVMYMLSGGNEEMVTRAKKTWTGAIIGLAIALAAPTFLKEIQALLGGNASPDAQSWISGALTIRQIAARVLSWLLSILGIIAVISLIIGGGMYLTAYGDDDRMQKAKKIITYAIIGIVVALSALIIVRQVGNLLGAQF